MAGRSQNGKFRPDSGKWWFEGETDDLRVLKKNGPLKVSNKEMTNVTGVCESSDSSSVKVAFANNLKQVKLSLTLFDFSKNDFCQKFKNFTVSSTKFRDRFVEITKGETIVRECDLNKKQTPAVQSLIDTEGKDQELSADSRPSNTTRGKRKLSHIQQESPQVPTKAKKPSEDEKEDTDAIFIDNVAEKYQIAGTFKILTDCLCPPRETFTLRNLDESYVNVLKSELLQRPLSFAKPLIGIVKGLHDKSHFVHAQIESYEIEIIGGNHRRQALIEIQQEGHAPESLKFADVQLYTEMPTVDALRLAQLHNHIDKMNHEVTTREKVQLCRNLLNKMFHAQKSQEWRQTCQSVLGESVQRLEIVFFLSGLSSTLHSLVDSILEKYGKLEILGQKVTTKILKTMSSNSNESGLQTTIDCPISKFKCLRGNLSEEEVESLLNKVDKGEMSFAGLEKECRRLKEIKDLQKHLLEQSACQSWDEAKQRFSAWVADEKLEAYRGQLKTSPHRFNFYISSMLKWEQEKEIGGDECPQENQVTLKINDSDISAFFICSDVTTLTHTALSKSVKKFPGSTLIFLNLPKDWEKSSMEKAFRNIKAITTRHYRTGGFRIVVFPHDPNPFGQLSLAADVAKAAGMTCEVAYYHDRNKSWKEGNSLTRTINPFCLISYDVETTTKVKRGDLFAYNTPFPKGGATNKPWELHKDIMELYNEEGGWVMDLCSGSGSVAFASLKKGKHCLVVDTNMDKLQAIRRKLEEEFALGEKETGR